MPRIKLTKPSFANLTGQLPGKNFRGVNFTDGISGDIPLEVVDKIAAQIGGDLVDGQGAVLGPAGSHYRKTSTIPTKTVPRATSLPSDDIKTARGYRIGVIGTSLVNHNDFGTTSFSKISHSSRGWMSWARFYAQGLFVSPVWYDATVYRGWEPFGTPNTTRYFQGLNAGVSGDTGDQIWKRREYLTKNVDCDIVVIDAGTNDYLDAATFTKERTQELRERLADYYLSFGKIVILLPILARNTNVLPAGGATRARMHWMNQKTRDFVRSRRSCYFFDWNEAWVDAASANGTPNTGFSADGTHFLPKGGEAVGKAFADFLKTILPAGPKRVTAPDDLFMAGENPRGNILTNAFLTGTAGANGTGATGSVATGMRVERISGASTVVNSLEARPGRGNYQVMTFTLSGAAEDKFYFRPSTTDTPHQLAAGDWVQASCEIETNNYAGFVGVSLLCLDLATGGHYSYAMEPYNSGSANERWAAQARSGLLLTPPFQLKAGSTALKWRVEIVLAASVAGSPVVKVGAVELRQVENPKKALNWHPPV
ncbi:SGNH/GDSL hydrolase family protein [Ensifer sp. ENS10]|uniref:SGNH/GDSL hydrolase family protein n=1 Tax=Ensifer sp. ENS10 TaxID=2769286 RepID=UPI001785FE70|nr:SGNH/GDSL hydrolase family protein [Ensifer sp. ENS10]MBD9511626.1 SGNH/GDSL hydrolase family protein [Ensifer sp. ENS10]